MRSIDYAASEARYLTILRDLKIKYLKKAEAKLVSDLIKPKKLSIANKNLPAYVSAHSRSLLDYNITTKSLCKETLVAEVPFNTDHLITI